MDPELRAYLEAMRAEMAARDAETRQLMEGMEQRAVARDAATRAVAEAALQAATAAQQGVETARQEARVLHEQTWQKIEALGEGLSTHQRDEADRLDAAREESLLNAHILPLEASAANHEHRLVALEQQSPR